MTPYHPICDDFVLSVHLNTKMDLPSRRETILHFFESLQKWYPRLTEFERRDNGDFSLEEDRETGSYRWVTLEPRRLSLGYVNPPQLEEADAAAERLLELAPAHLDLSLLDVEALDVMFAFDFMYAGNHDEVVAEALASGTPFEHLLHIPGSKVLNFEPMVMLALDDSCRLQCRLHIETRTNAYQVRTGQFPESALSVFFTVRQYWGKATLPKYLDSYRNQRRIAQEIVDSQIVPQVLRPLSQAISTR
jgi:hypothetical protein